MTIEKKDNAHPEIKVRVSAPARLHLGFLDLNGETGRKFGSIGLTIDSHHTIIEAELASSTSITSSTIDVPPPLTEKVIDLISQFYRSLGKHISLDQHGVHITLIELIPQHAGLGSGTQLALTLGTLLCRLHNITASTHDIAHHLGRGSRSGIGISGFEHGGFIIDGGLGLQSSPPPLLAHYTFPEQWRVILITESNSQGVHGKNEHNAFTHLPAFSLADSQTICHLTLMTLLPALVEKNMADFGHAITKIQSLIGNHFSPAQGGQYASKNVAQLLHHAQSIGHMGVAQSSWGPTGCIFIDSETAANTLQQELTYYAQKEQLTMLSLLTISSSSKGANIEITLT